MTDNQWQFIKKILNFNNRKRKHDLRITWNAIMDLVKTGCQWRMLPKDGLLKELFPGLKMIEDYVEIMNF